MKQMGILRTGVTASVDANRSSRAGLERLVDTHDLGCWSSTDLANGVASGADEVKVFAVDLVNEQPIRLQMAIADVLSVAAQGVVFETRG